MAAIARSNPAASSFFGDGVGQRTPAERPRVHHKCGHRNLSEETASRGVLQVIPWYRGLFGIAPRRTVLASAAPSSRSWRASPYECEWG